MKLTEAYFSPTGTTREVADTVADAIGDALDCMPRIINLTYPRAREKGYQFGPEDLLVFGCPVNAGRLPNKIMPAIRDSFHGDKTPVILLNTYGNRAYDEAVREFVMLMEGNGFLVMGAAAIVCRHTFSQTIAKGRPTFRELDELKAFGVEMLEKIRGLDDLRKGLIDIDRETPIGPYYIPKKEDGSPANFLKAKPVTDFDRCVPCSRCAEVCSMGIISRDDPSDIQGACIKCQACVRKCPRGAKSFIDEEFLSHVKMLEENYTEPKENVFWR